MKFSILFILYCLSNFLFANQLDSIQINPNNIDALKVSLSNDTINIKSKILENKKSFWDRNETQIISFSLSAILALFSIWLTNRIRNRKELKQDEKVRKERERKEKIERVRKEEIYCGLLHSIFHDMNGHQRLLELNWKSLELIRDITIENDRPVIEGSVIENFTTEFINECRLKILEFEGYDTDLLPLISEYINRINNLNKILDVKPKLDSIVSMNLPFKESVIKYFEEIKKYIDDTNTGVNGLKKSIKNEIEKITQSDFEDNT